MSRSTLRSLSLVVAFAIVAAVPRLLQHGRHNGRSLPWASALLTAQPPPNFSSVQPQPAAPLPASLGGDAYQQAVIALHRGEHVAAADALQTYLTTHPHSELGHNLLGYTLWQLGDAAAADHHFRQTSNAPFYLAALADDLLATAETRSTAGDTAAAEAATTEARQLGRLAIAHLQSRSNLSHHNHYLIGYWSLRYATDPAELANGLAHAQQAAASQPTNPDYGRLVADLTARLNQ